MSNQSLRTISRMVAVLALATVAYSAGRAACEVRCLSRICWKNWDSKCYRPLEDAPCYHWFVFISGCSPNDCTLNGAVTNYYRQSSSCSACDPIQTNNGGASACPDWTGETFNWVCGTSCQQKNPTTP